MRKDFAPEHLHSGAVASAAFSGPCAIILHTSSNTSALRAPPACLAPRPRLPAGRRRSWRGLLLPCALRGARLCTRAPTVVWVLPPLHCYLTREAGRLLHMPQGCLAAGWPGWARPCRGDLDVHTKRAAPAPCSLTRAARSCTRDMRVARLFLSPAPRHGGAGPGTHTRTTPPSIRFRHHRWLRFLPRALLASLDRPLGNTCAASRARAPSGRRGAVRMAIAPAPLAAARLCSPRVEGHRSLARVAVCRVSEDSCQHRFCASGLAGWHSHTAAAPGRQGAVAFPCPTPPFVGQHTSLLPCLQSNPRTA